MPSPDSLGASGRYIQIDLTTASYPLYFRPLFAAKYPDDRTFQAQAVSRTILALGGSGNIDLITTLGGIVSAMNFEEGEADGVQAVGVNAQPVSITMIKVLL